MWLCFICNVYVYIHIPSYNHLMVHITIWNILQLFNDNNTCRVSGSLGQLVPKLMTSLLNVLFIEFRVIPPNVGQKVSVSAELPKFYLGFKKRMALKFVYFLNNWNNNDKDWASLVVQWLKICLQMQGTQVRSLEDSACPGATKPVGHNCWACTLEPILHNKRSHHNEKPGHHNERILPLAASRESPNAAVKTQHSQK